MRTVPSDMADARLGLLPCTSCAPATALVTRDGLLRRRNREVRVRTTDEDILLET